MQETRKRLAATEFCYQSTELVAHVSEDNCPRGLLIFDKGTHQGRHYLLHSFSHTHTHLCFPQCILLSVLKKNTKKSTELPNKRKNCRCQCQNQHCRKAAHCHQKVRSLSSCNSDRTHYDHHRQVAPQQTRKLAGLARFCLCGNRRHFGGWGGGEETLQKAGLACGLEIFLFCLKPGKKNSSSKPATVLSTYHSYRQCIVLLVHIHLTNQQKLHIHLTNQQKLLLNSDWRCPNQPGFPWGRWH